MTDAPSVLRAFLLAQGSLEAVVGTRIWPERFEPPRGYTPAQGPGIAFRSRGGSIDYTSTMLRNSWQFKCYGANEMIANQAYRALMDVLHDAPKLSARAGDDVLKWAMSEIPGQTVSEPDTGWIYVLCYFETEMRAGIPA